MAIYSIDGHAPTLANDVFVVDNATVIGRVTLEAGTSVWFNAVLRADGDRIVVGERSNVQDGAVLHVDPGFPLTIGARVSVGHQAMLHGCTIGAGSLIGIKAVVLNGAVIGEQCQVGAGAVVTEGKRFPPRTLLLGAPARVARELTDKDLALLESAARNYMRRAALYRESLRRVDTSAPPALASHGEI
ncbi:MAG TPA: gamma carbonic anhydrase family protein [Burkholderiaceae bacterium]|nr:gamma carbonic anhydrase family protein [Burkholderiaceae bacterium]